MNNSCMSVVVPPLAATAAVCPLHADGNKWYAALVYKPEVSSLTYQLKTLLFSPELLSLPLLLPVTCYTLSLRLGGTFETGAPLHCVSLTLSLCNAFVRNVDCPLFSNHNQLCTHASCFPQDTSHRGGQQPGGPCMPDSWKKGDSIGSGSFGSVFLVLNCETGALALPGNCPTILGRHRQCAV